MVTDAECTGYAAGHAGQHPVVAGPRTPDIEGSEVGV